MMVKRLTATKAGEDSGLLKNVVVKGGYAYKDKYGNFIEAHRAMIVRAREVDVIRLILRSFGIAAFRNELAFARALKLTNSGKAA